MKPEPLDLEELADEIIRVEYPTYEQTTIPQMKNSIIRKKQQIKFILEQRIKSACKFYLRYKDKLELFWLEQQDKLNDKEKTEFLTFDDKLRGLPEKMDRDGWDYCDELEIIQDYNEWLFKLAFKDVMKNDTNR